MVITDNYAKKTIHKTIKKHIDKYQKKYSTGQDCSEKLQLEDIVWYSGYNPMKSKMEATYDKIGTVKGIGNKAVLLLLDGKLSWISKKFLKKKM